MEQSKSKLPPYKFIIDLWDYAVDKFQSPPTVKNVDDLATYREFGYECLQKIFKEKIDVVFNNFDLVGIEYRSLSRRFLPGSFSEEPWQPFFYGSLKDTSEYDEFLRKVYRKTSFPFLNLLRRNWFFVYYSGLKEPTKHVNLDRHIVFTPNLSEDNLHKKSNSFPLDLKLDDLYEQFTMFLNNSESFYASNESQNFYESRGQKESELRQVIERSSSITLEILRRTGEQRYALFIPTYVRDLRIGGMVFMGTGLLKEEECDFLELVSKNVLTAFRMIEESATQKNILLEKEKDDLRSFLLHRLSHNIRHPLNDSKLKAAQIESTANRLVSDLNESMKMVDTTLASIAGGLPEEIRINKQSDNVAEFLEDIKWGQRSAIPENRRLILEKESVQNVFFDFDASIIKEVLRNLIKNSIRYAVGDITLIAYLKDSNLVFDIRDIGKDGEGLKDNVRETLFEPKFREATGSDIGGSGIGLWICKQLMQAHGLSIAEVSKEEGYTQGTFFRIIVGEPIKGETYEKDHVN